MDWPTLVIFDGLGLGFAVWMERRIVELVENFLGWAFALHLGRIGPASFEVTLLG